MPDAWGICRGLFRLTLPPALILIFAFAATKVYEIIPLLFRGFSFCLLYLLIVLSFIVFIVALLLRSRPIVFLYLIVCFSLCSVCVYVTDCSLYISPYREGPFLDVQRNLLTLSIRMFLLRVLWMLHVRIHFCGVVVTGRSISSCFFFIWRTLVRL